MHTFTLVGVDLVRERDPGKAEVFVEFAWTTPDHTGPPGQRTGIEKMRAGESRDFGRPTLFPPLDVPWIYWTARVVEHDSDFESLGHLLDQFLGNPAIRGLISLTAAAPFLPVLDSGSALVRAGAEFFLRDDELARASGYVWPDMGATFLTIKGPESGPSANFQLDSRPAT